MTPAARVRRYLDLRAQAPDSNFNEIHVWHLNVLHLCIQYHAELLVSDLQALLAENDRLRAIEAAARVQYEAHGAYSGLVSALGVTP